MTVGTLIGALLSVLPYSTAVTGQPLVTVETATVTAYCSQCSDGGEARTATEPGLYAFCAAADPRYWAISPHAEREGLVWLNIPGRWGGPRLVPLNDTGSAIKGPARFDLCMGHQDRCRCGEWGVRKLSFVAVRGRR